MRQFMDENFLLNNEVAAYLYHQYAENMPIYDYHCHLNPKEIYEDKKYNDITEVWLNEGKYGDHYKWRLLRANGVSEDYITGNKSHREKFRKWAETIPYTCGNPLYNWTHMELRKYFDIYETLDGNNADKIYDECNEKLKTMTARKFIDASNVKLICTTDDPVDDLHWHELLAADKSFSTKVLPAFRPDKFVNINLETFIPWMDKLELVVGYKINSIASLEKALDERIQYFHAHGCRLSDHGLDELVYEEATEIELNEIVKMAMEGKHLSNKEIAKYKGHMLVFFGKEYNKYNWTQQYHIKALRNNSKRMYGVLGADTGFDAVNDGNIAIALSTILSKLDEKDELPRTILYSLNQNDNEVLATLAYCFNDGKTVGKMQLGSAWWFNDQKSGMEKQLTALSSVGLLSRFVGMLTDSRSFLSYTRHDYFRRILCNKIGELVENGEYPYDMKFLGKMVQDICYNNAYNYFNML